MIGVKGPPRRWIAKGGRPADVLWDYKPSPGLPSYESDHALLFVMDTLIVTSISRTPEQHPGCASIAGPDDALLLPLSYNMAALRSVLVGDHELVALHDDPAAEWVWRPLGYQFVNGELVRMGSQQELEWRWAFHETDTRRRELDGEIAVFMFEQLLEMKRLYGRTPILERKPGQHGFRLPKNARKRLHRAYVARLEELRDQEPAFEYRLANEKAERILREHLAPQQRLDVNAWNRFYVRGTINPLYCVRLGNGASICNPSTGQEWISLCIHPERWMPHADVALAVKMLIESGPEGEEELLAGARAVTLRPGSSATRAEKYAWDGMIALLPSPLEDF